jgi:two-component system, LytTR family, sensor kinase
MRLVFKRKYLFHLLVWLMLAIFMLTEMQYYIKQKGWLFVMGPMFTSLSLMAMLVYTNTLLLIPQLLQKKRMLLYILGIFTVVIVYTYGRSVAQRYWDAVVWPEEPMNVTDYIHVNFVYSWWLLLISSMLYFTQKWTEQRQQVKNIQINQLQTELKYLRSQVNPHFLFNGLNTIYGNIDIRDQKARDILLQFADLLRYNLYEADVDLVDLEKESIYLQNYVALQRARSNENLQIELDVLIENKDLKIAPLLFIPFIENAFKFSTRDDNRPNRIQIRLRQNGNNIEFTCSNTYESMEQNGGGIGLSNVKRRLELLYKDRYELNIQKEQSVYTVNLKLMV